MLLDAEGRAMTTATLSCAVNVAFAIYFLIMGVTGHSAWFITFFAYYLVLGLLRVGAVHAAVRGQALSAEERVVSERRLMWRTGAVLLLMTVVMSGIVVLTVKEDHLVAGTVVGMIAKAAYTFGKVAAAIVNYVRARGKASPYVQVVRNVSISDAAISILPFQTAMIATFDTGEGMDLEFMTIVVGAAVAVVLLVLGVQLIRGAFRRPSREAMDLLDS